MQPNLTDIKQEPIKISPKTDNTSSQDSGTGSQNGLEAHSKEVLNEQGERDRGNQVKVNSNSSHSSASQNSAGFYSNCSEQQMQQMQQQKRNLPGQGPPPKLKPKPAPAKLNQAQNK